MAKSLFRLLQNILVAKIGFAAGVGVAAQDVGVQHVLEHILAHDLARKSDGGILAGGIHGTDGSADGTGFTDVVRGVRIVPVDTQMQAELPQVVAEGVVVQHVDRLHVAGLQVDRRQPVFPSASAAGRRGS